MWGECVKWEPTARFAFSVQRLTGVGATEFRILCGPLVILKSCHTGFNKTLRRGYNTMPGRFSVLLVYSTTIISLYVCLIFSSFRVSSYLLSRDSSVGIATGRADCSCPYRPTYFSFPQLVYHLRGQPNLLAKKYWGLFPTW